ncbi:MAG: type VI secretion system ATPase TssH [Phycisphaerales bacterium]
MAGIDNKALFGKLNSIAYKAVEGGTVFCKLRGNPVVEVEHILQQILQLQDSDAHRILKHFEINASRLAADMTAALDRLPRGATSISDFSQNLLLGVKEAWLYATLQFGEGAVRTGHLVYAWVATRDMRLVLPGISPEFAKIKPEALGENFAKIVAGSPEEALTAKDGSTPTGGGAAPGEASGAMAPAQMGKQQAIKQFCKDLTQQARDKKIDPIVGRDDETRQVVDILMRRRQNNPVLVGEAGVGKTAVVEGFAHKIISGDVPPPLKEVRLLELDLGALQAGASMKGEFENRLKQVIEEVQASPKPIVMFIDEVHTLMGAGGSAGTGDAAQLLKPALARGTLRTIGATTWAEYKKHIEKDPALTRRFQTVKVEEPDEAKAILMMRKVGDMLEKHHKVQVLDEAIEASVRLSHRYIQGRQLPDKSVSLLDTACSRVAVGQHAVPAEVDDTRKRIEALTTELEILARETAVGFDHTARVADVNARMDEQKASLATLEENWKKEKDLVEKILEIRHKLRGPSKTEPVEKTGTPAADAAAAAAKKDPVASQQLSDTDRAALLDELRKFQGQLAEVQGETPLILPSVDAQAVAAVVADWTGIPVGKMVKNEIEAVLKLADTLNARIIGQRHALEAISKRIQTSRAGLENPSKPIGVFLLAGTSGVGKTETALALAEALYGGEDNVVTINMSEYKEEHKVATLMGPPPGYVGFGSGGVLTEAIRRKPYSVLLLDEIEKAHPSIHEVFFQVFDKGTMKDSEGTEVSFKNTIILLTTNVGSDLIMNMCKDPELLPDVKSLTEAMRAPLLQKFPAALLGRMFTIPFYPLSDEMIREITKLQLGRIAKRIRHNHKAELVIAPEVYDLIASRCTEVESGGRAIDAILTQTMLPELSNEFLSRMMAGGEIKKVHVGVKDGDFSYSFE